MLRLASFTSWRRIAAGAAGGLLAAVVAALIGAVATGSDLLGTGAYSVIVLGVIAGVVLGVERWYASTDSFPQWRYDAPHLDLEIAEPQDRWHEDWLQGLHLTVKNRPQKSRKTRPATNAWLHTIFDGGDIGGEFRVQLVWATFGPVKKIVDLVPGDRVYVPLAMKAHGAIPAVPPEVLVSDHARLGQANPGVTFLMDDRYHYGNPHPLAPGQYNIAAWIEYDGGRQTPRVSLTLHVEKGATSINRVEYDSECAPHR